MATADNLPQYPVMPTPTALSPPPSTVEKPPAGPAPVVTLPEPPVSKKLFARLKTLDGLLIVMVLALAFVLASFPVRNSDFLMHLATGRLLVEGQYVFGSNPYTAASADVWINHSWLFDLLFYGLYSIPSLGPVLVVVVKALLILVLAEILLRVATPPGRRLWIPASCVALAVLTFSPRLLLQPTIMSYLFLGLTLWLLRRPAERRWAWWLLPPLFALWVNCDEWFFLGPLCAGLYLLGHVLQGQLPTMMHQAERLRPEECRRLGLVVVVGAAACLVNPFGIYAWTLPAQLGLSPAAAALHDDPIFRYMWVSPFRFDGPYFQVNSGLSVAGLSYFVLLLAGGVSFVLLGQDQQAWRLLLWLPLALLSASNARSIPFFAIVAGPITALNFLDFAALKLGGEPRLDRAGRNWTLGGRVLTLVAGLALLIAGVPGWLQAQPHANRRLGWNVVLDPGLQQAARQIRQWQPLLPDDLVWFNVAPDVVNYLAWFCPGQRGFVDLRLLMDEQAARDLVEMRESLAKLEQPAEGKEPAWREILSRHRIRYLVHHEGDSPQPSGFLLSLLARPDEWTPLFLAGGTVIFGWQNAKLDPLPSGLPFDLDRLAFGSDAEPAPADRPAPAVPFDWYTALWQAPPRRPVEAQTARMYRLVFNHQQQMYPVRLWRLAMVAAAFGAGARHTDPQSPGWLAVSQLALLPLAPADTSALPRVLRELPYLRLARLWLGQYLGPDMAPPGGLYLAVRAARKALEANPGDAQTHLLLGQVYNQLANGTSEARLGQGWPALGRVRQAQILASLQQALALDPDLEDAHALLAGLYWRLGAVDLAFEHRKEQLRLERARGFRPPETREQALEGLSRLEKETQALEALRKRLEDHYVLITAGKPPLERTVRALRLVDPDQKGQRTEYQLVREALKAAQEIKKEEMVIRQGDQVFSPGAQLQIDLRLLLGQLPEVREVLEDRDPSGEPVWKKLLGKHPDLGLPAYGWYQICLGAASGDYGSADAALEEMIPQSERDPAKMRALQHLRTQIGIRIGNVLQQEALRATGCPPWLPWATGHPWQLEVQEVLKNSHLLLDLQGGPSDLHTLRGMLLLERGAVPEAQQQLRQALERKWFRAQPIAQMAQRWLQPRE